MIDIPFIGPVGMPPPEWMLAFQVLVVSLQAAMLLVVVTRVRRIVADRISTSNAIRIVPPRQPAGG